MPISLKGKHFLTLKDFSPREVRYLLELAENFQNNKRCGIKTNALQGKNICLIFDKPSTRTRCAFQTAAVDEGAFVTFLTDSHMGKKESIADTAKVLGRFYDGIEYRGYAQEIVETLAENAGVPVWNGLTDQYHPTQILADFMSIRDRTSKDFSEVKLVFVGDTRNNMGNSLMIGAAKVGMHFVGLAPKALWPDEKLVSEMRAEAEKTGAIIEFNENIDAAVKGADVIYTDVWVSMGEEDKYEERIKLLTPYKVTMDMLRKSGNPQVKFMHCLPSFHDKNTVVGKEICEKFGLTELEVTDEVFQSRYSIVFDEAENRVHSIKAIMVATIGNV